MTDHPSEPPVEPGPELSEAEAADVSRLLAEARHDGPIPADVAARLDAALAGLRTADGIGTGPPDPTGQGRVADLAARRRRAGRLLLAAAAAVVVGVGVGAIHDRIGMPGSGTDGAGSAASSAGSGPGSSSGAAGGAHPPAYLPHALGRPVRLTAPRFAEQVRRLRRLRRDGLEAALAGRADQLGATPSAPGATNGPRSHAVEDAATCVPGGVTGAVLVPVRYAGDPGLLAFRAPTGDSEVVDLYLCGQDGPVRSVTLPAP